MTNEELDEARVEEASRRLNSNDPTIPDIATGAARLARENWTPPEPVDPDLLAFREWFAAYAPNSRERILAGEWDQCLTNQAYLAGARMAREQERAKELVECAKSRVPLTDAARDFFAKYRGEA